MIDVDANRAVRPESAEYDFLQDLERVRAQRTTPPQPSPLRMSASDRRWFVASLVWLSAYVVVTIAMYVGR